MLVTSKQAYIFRKEQRTGEGKDELTLYVDKFKLPPTEFPIQAPEWIKETRLWQLAMQDRTIVEFGERTSSGLSVVQRGENAQPRLEHAEFEPVRPPASA